jgi:ribosomal protein S14
MLKPAGCPNPHCDSHEFEQTNDISREFLIVQCAKCGRPIGTINNLFQIKNTLRNIARKIGAEATI